MASRVRKLLTAGSAEYEATRRSQIARFDDVRPRAIAQCEDAEDVAQSLAWAQEEGLHVALRSGGHCFAGRSSTTGLIIDMSRLNAVRISRDDTVTVGAGARLGDIYDALASEGRTIAAGCGPTVGIAGLTLGGGLGVLGRAHGLTADQLIAAQVVLADGRVVDCDERTHADLFWALRGAGGGQFGVVTQLTLRTLAAPEATGFHLVWPWSAATAVINAWQGWAPDAPEAIAASLLGRGPADEDPHVIVVGAMLDQESATRAALDELIGLVDAAPWDASYAPGAYREVKRYLAEYDVGSGQWRSVQREPGHSYSRSEFFARELSAETIAELVAHLTAPQTQRDTRLLDFTPLGGAYNRVGADATAFAHRTERFLLKHEIIIDARASDADREVARGWLERSWALAHPAGSRGVYPNFPDPQLAQSDRAYHGANLDRLTQVKSTYDPDNVFRFHQSVQPRR